MTTKNSKENIVSIRITGFLIKKYEFRKPDKDSDTLGYYIDISINNDIDKVSIIINVKAKESEDTEKHFCEIETSTDYALHHSDEDKGKVTSKILSKLVDIAFANTRGALVAKTEGTFLEKIPLPLTKYEEGDLKKESSEKTG